MDDPTKVDGLHANLTERSDDEFHNVERSKPTQITLIHSCLALNQICLILIN